MKKIAFSLVFLSIGILVTAQSSIVHNQAALGEKHNQLLRGLPKILLHAFCAGEIPGYYPNNVKAQVSFTEMLNYAHIGDPTFFENQLKCPHEFCNLSKDELIKFQHQLELLEYKQDAAVGQEPTTKTHYVRLKMLHNQKYYNGPVFYLKDILKLENRYQLYNPKNDAAPVSIKKLFLARMFSTKLIKNYTYPKVEKRINGKNTTDDDNFEY